MVDLAACDTFISKWRDREPGMEIAERFCAAAQRVRFRVWGALLSELREAAFELSDAHVIEVKSAWWVDELLHAGNDQPRHPLTKALTGEIGNLASWGELARGVAAAAASDLRPAEREAAMQAVQPFATAIVRFERALFAGPASGDLESTGERQSARDQLRSEAQDVVASNVDGVQATCVHLLTQRLQTGLRSDDAGRIPLSLLARHRINATQLADAQGAAVIGGWAGQLLASTVARPRFDTIYRAVRSALDRSELKKLAQTSSNQSVPRVERFAPLRDLWITWRAARHVSRAG